MKTIAVPLSKSGHARWTTQHYEIKGWKRRPMVIPHCARCVALMILWKPKDPSRHGIYSVTAVHIPPYVGKSITFSSRYFFKSIVKEMPHSVPYFVIVAGGRINTPQNRVHYVRTLKKFVHPFLHYFADVQYSRARLNETTMFSTLILQENGKFNLRTRELDPESVLP